MSELAYKTLCELGLSFPNLILTPTTHTKSLLQTGPATTWQPAGVSLPAIRPQYNILHQGSCQFVSSQIGT